MKILIVEDDPHLSEALEQIMKDQGYFTDAVDNGMDGLYYASNNDYDVIVLDVMLPKMNGFDVIKMLRKQKIATPTIMLTAKSETDDKIEGLDSGADDYMVKPFSPKELLARVRALSRRTGEVVLDELGFGDIVLNLNTYSLSTRRKSVSLSNKEFQIMTILMFNPTAVISKDMLIDKVWGIESDTEDNNVEAYISFIRKKLIYVDSKVSVRTIRMAGYTLEEAASDD
jgi:DNA-binding response OmpR family regulator